MVQLAIRCHPRVPVAADELQRWLELQVKDLRAQAPRGTIRLSRLTQKLQDALLDIGWLIELELHPDEPLLAGNRITESLRDMRLLGLQPTLLAPAPPQAWSNRNESGVAMRTIACGLDETTDTSQAASS